MPRSMKSLYQWASLNGWIKSHQDNFFTSSIDREVASDSFSPIYQIAVFGWLHMVQ